MDLADNVEFRNRLVALGEVFDVKFSPQRLALYFEALRDLPFSTVAQALNQAVKTCKFLPRPAEIRQLAVGDVEDATEAAWMALRAAMHTAGGYASLVVDAALGEAVTAVFGSWPDACALELTPEMWAAKRKEFGRVYRVLTNRGLVGGRYLCGISERQNAGRQDWLKHVPVYRLVGDAIEPLTLEAAETARARLAAAASGFKQLSDGEEIDWKRKAAGE